MKFEIRDEDHLIGGRNFKITIKKLNGEIILNDYLIAGLLGISLKSYRLRISKYNARFTSYCDERYFPTANDAQDAIDKVIKPLLAKRIKYNSYKDFPETIQFEGRTFYKVGYGRGETFDVYNYLAHRYTSDPDGNWLDNIPLYMDATGHIAWD